MNNTTRILIVEDDTNDYNLAQVEIRKVVQGSTFKRVEKQNDYLQALEEFQPHVILSDYKLPSFNGIKVLELAQQHLPFSPVIIWTGAMSEEMAVECMKMGASDYILKDNIKRLGRAVIQALKEREILLERKQAEEKYQAIFENSPIGIFQSTPQGQFLRVNPAMARIYGYASPQEMIRSITDISRQIYRAPKDRREFTTQLETEQIVQNFEWANIRKDGSVFWTSTSARTVCDEAGNILYYEGFLEDITDRKLAEARLRESEARYHSIFENAQDAIFMESLEGDILEVNQRACEVFGYTRQEFLQKKVADIIPAEGQAIYSPSDNSLIGQTVEAVNVRANGEHFPVEIRGGWYEFGDHRSILVILRDITERRQTEEKLREQDKRFRALIENGMDNVSLLAKDGTLLWETPTTHGTLGYEAGQFLDQNIFDLMHPDDLGWTSKLFTELVRQPGKIQPAIFRLKHHDGTWRWMEATATNMLDEPSVNAVVINYRDVTSRVEAETRINDLLSLNEKMLNHSPLGILTYKVTGPCVFANQNAATIVGTTVEHLMSQNFHSIESWEKSGLYELVEKAISTKTVASGDIHHISSFGKDAWLAAHCVTFTSRDEERVLLSISDITERKQAENALQESEEKYRLLFENNPLPMWIYDLETLRFLKVNDAAVQHYGYSLDEFMAMTIKNIRPSEDVPKLLENIDRVTNGIGQAGIWRHCKKDGTVILMDIISHTVEFGGRSGKLVLAIDVTERKQAEEKLIYSQHELSEAQRVAKIGSWSFDAHSNMVYWSEELYQIFGVERETFGHTYDAFTSLVHQDDRLLVAQKHAAALERGLSFDIEYRIVTPEGKLKTIGEIGYARTADNGKVTSLFGTAQDISQRKQAEIERQALLDIMQGLANTKDLQEFLELVHHSLGNVIYAENFFVVLYHQESKLFEEIYSVDQYDPPAPPSKLEKSITSYVFGSGEPLLLTQESFEELVEQGEIELVGTDSASWLGVPLKTSNGTIGVIAVQDYHDPTRYSEHDKDFLASVASQVALAMERKQAESELQQKNDDLGLLNAINEAVVRDQDLDSIVKLLSDELKRIFSTVGSTIYMLSSDKRSITMQQYSFSAEIAARIEKLLGFKIPQIQIPVKEGGHFHNAMISKQSTITTDPKEIQDWIAEFAETKFLPAVAKLAVRRLIPHIYKLLNIKSTIIIPLLSQDEVIGFLDVSSSNILTTQELRRISGIGEQLSSLLQRQQAAERIRKSEEFLQGVQNSLSANIAILNQQGEIVQVNSAWCEFGKRNGLQSQNNCLGVNYLNVCESATGPDADVARQVEMAIREVLAGQRKELSVEYPCHSPEEKRWFTVHITCFDDDEQKWVILAHENITERKQAEAAERDQRVMAEALRDTSQILSSSLDYGDVLDHILTSVGNVVPHDAATIMLIDGISAHVVRAQGYQQRDPNTAVMQVRLPLAETTNLRQMLETKQPIVIYDTFSFPGWKRLDTTDWLRSNVGAPISVLGQVIGFILLDSQTPGFFTPVHAERLEAFANQAALAIQNARLLQQAQDEIVERKHAEESLRMERERAQNYLDIAGVIMLALDQQGTVTLINQKGCEILRYSAEEVIGKNWIKTFVPEASREEMQSTFQKLISGDIESVDYYENTVLTRNGEERLIAWHNTLVHDAQSKIISTLSSGEDITERKLAEQELRTSEERFSQLAHNIEEAFWMTDAETGEEIYISPAAAAIWGNSVENILEEPDAFIQSVLSEDRPHVLAAMEQQRKGEKTEIEYRVQRLDGSIRWVWDRAFPIFDESGMVKTLAGIAADITERKQAEIDLIQSQARYQDLFDSSPISLWEEDYSLVKKRIESLQQEGITDLQEYFSSHPDVILELASSVKVIGVNRASMELYNVSQKDELLRSLPEFVSDETLLHFQHEVLGLMSRAKFEWEGLDHTLDGRKLIVMVNGSIPPGHEADWAKVIVSITDVTERKLAEEKLRASEERYHSLFQHLVDGFALHEIITDDQGKPVDYRFLEINPAFEKLTGLRAETTVGRRANEILPKVGNEHFIAIYGKVALTGEPIHFEEYSAPLGKYFEINAYSPRRGQFAITFEDITERKQAEANLRKLSRAVDQSASTIVITDIQGRIEYVNPKFTEVTGYSFEEANGQNPRILKTGHTPVQEYKQLWETITVGGEWRGELFNRKKNGDLFWEQVTISPIQNEQGEITHFIAVKEDITQRKQSEAEIQRHLLELQAVYENGLAVGKLLEPQQIGEHLIETFARHLSWHHVTIRLLRPETDELELIAFNLPNINQPDKLEVGNHFNRVINRVGQGLSGWVVQTGISVRSGQVNSHPQYISTQVGIESGLYMPLKIGDRIIGVISVESEEPDAFTEQDERLLATLATQAAIAFENARLYQAAQQEIAERVRAQAALRTSETHYRELADSITEIMFELDQNLHYTHWNRASEIFSGIAAEDAIGQSMLDVFAESEEQSAREKIYRSVLTEGQAQTFETEVFPQGQRRILEINAYPSARGVSVVARDITERRLSEALQQRRIALMEFSAHHNLEELMQRAIDEVSELTDSHIGFLHFVDADQKVIHMQAWSSETIRTVGMIEEKGMHYPIESAGVWADAVRQRRPIIHNDYASLPEKKGLPVGHVPVIRELVVPILRDDRIAGVLGIGNSPRPYDEHDVEITQRFADYAWDIIERRQMESALSDERNQLAKRVEERTADLSRANSNLARALRVKDEFLANMSHELRTPLNAILGLSESLSEQVAGPLNEKQQKYLNTINESGHHLLSLINDILDLAKIEAGQISLDINKVDVNSVCQASLRMIKQLAQKKNQEVLFEIDNGLGLMWADERRLKQMIVNLLSNAVKFTPENGKLGLEVHGDQAANRVLITVWDRGIGITNQDLDRLFRPFVQLDSSLAREATGTGLGLALVAQMARLHGGSVNVDSHVGEGSRFTIQLPWEPALAAEVSSRLRTSGKFRAIDVHAKNKPTILLIEDTREVVMMLADYLEMAGFTIATAQDGIDGLEQAKLKHPHLILMDIQMPRMDGFETTQKLRMIPEFKDTPIIALTALAMPNDRQRCLDAGMSEYISKPVNLKMLLKLIRGILYEKEGDLT